MKSILSVGQRKIQIEDVGDANGLPVIFHGGTPGSSTLLDDWVQDALAHGVRLIGYARPGYGDSTRMEGRSVSDAADDVLQIAQHLGLPRFATIGASGGGPHAIATAALLPDRVIAAVSMASPAPFEAAGLDWFAGMDAGGAAEFHAAQSGREAMEAFARDALPGIVNTSPDDMAIGFRSMSQFESNYPLLERIGRWFSVASRDGLKGGAGGWVDDDLAFCKPWGIDLASIRVPILLLHGTHDVLVPVAHGHWLAEHIPSSRLQVFDEDDHGTIFGKRFSTARTWLAEHNQPE